MTSATSSWLSPHPRNWQLASCQLTPAFSSSLPHTQVAPPLAQNHTYPFKVSLCPPTSSSCTLLFLFQEKQTNKQKTERSFLGIPSYSFPCGWILACSSAGAPFYLFSPSQGDQQSEPKESIGTLASLGTRDIKKTTLKGRHWLVSGKQLSALETSGHWMSCG